jgi:hypothetical protein
VSLNSPKGNGSQEADWTDEPLDAVYSGEESTLEFPGEVFDCANA